ncbi:MAG: hybrid sensor histidine kinase/response regulator, partial [Novosphingobium sp.]
MSDGASAGERRATDWLWVALGLAASIALLWLVVDQKLVVAGFGGGVLALGGLAYALSKRQPAEAPAELALPDWSVTVAAIEQSDPTAGTAIAITDRAGRLVCANRLFEQWFGAAFAPPRLPADEASLERLAKA